MVEPVTPSEGWGCLHLFCVVGDDADRQAVLAAVKSAHEDDHQVVPFAVLGHKADLGFMALGPDLWRLLETAVRRGGQPEEIVGPVPAGLRRPRARSLRPLAGQARGRRAGEGPPRLPG